MSSRWFKRGEHEGSPSLWRLLLMQMHRGYVLGLICIFSLVRLGAEIHTHPSEVLERGWGYAPRVASAAHTMQERFLYVSSTTGQTLPKTEPWQAMDVLMKEMNNRSLILPGQSADRYSFAQQIGYFSGDMRSLLGFDRPQTYLVVLQNTSEKRPNGGFFWSFAVVKISRGRIDEFTILDSYIPSYDRPNVVVRWPSRLEWFLPDRDIHFVSANKVGFTYHDGAHIQELYEKTYPGQRVRGVIFLRTDMFASLLPGFQQQQWERQFINAATDLIRKTNTFGKKEIYLQGVGQYMRGHAAQLVQGIFTQGLDLIQEGKINIYLTSVSGALHRYLRSHHLTTRFEEGRIYAWDSNLSYNKIDEFVTKTLTLRNYKGDVLRTGESDIIPFAEAVTAGPYQGMQKSGITQKAYTLQIDYRLSVPQTYVSYMAELEKRYNITLWQRERHILGLEPDRATRGVVYFPPQAVITSITWTLDEQSTFVTPFSQNAYYISSFSGNNMSSSVRIGFEM